MAKISLKKKTAPVAVVHRDCSMTLGERRRKMEMERKKLVVEPTPRAPTASDVKRALKAKQDRILRLLQPSFASAVSAGQTEDYLKKAYLVWFLRFPEVEPEITVEEAFKDDPMYEVHIIKAREKLIRTKLGWSTFLFPSRPAKPALEEGASVQWEKDLNAAIQEILDELPTIWNPDKDITFVKLEHIVALSKAREEGRLQGRREAMDDVY